MTEGKEEGEEEDEEEEEERPWMTPTEECAYAAISGEKETVNVASRPFPRSFSLHED